MTVSTIDVVVVIGLFSLAQIALGLWNRAEARRYRRIAKFEVIRGEFATARNQLIWLASEEKLSPESATFRQMYFLQTSMMHGFDAYHSVSRAFWRHALDRKFEPSPSAFGRESEHWNEPTKEMVIKTADALRKVWVGCVPFGTVLHVASRVATFVGASALQAIGRRLAPRALRNVWETEQSLRRQIAA